MVLSSQQLILIPQSGHLNQLLINNLYLNSDFVNIMLAS